MNATDRTIGGAATMPRLLSVEEAAELLAVSSSTIRNWIDRRSDPLHRTALDGRTTPLSHPAPRAARRAVGDYDLAATLQQLDKASGELANNTHQELRRGRSRRPSRNSRPREMDSADPGDIFEHSEARSK